jgi:Mg chelatase-like protein
MVAHINTVAFQGIEAVAVDVEVQITSGLPAFTIVGLADKAVGESRERVRAALSAIGLGLPPKRITVNLAPADLPKEGSHYDLPIALALLVAMGVLPAEELEEYVVLGEMGLNADIRAVPGVLPAALHASGLEKGLICPKASGGEAAWAGGGNVLAPPSLIALVNHFKGTQVLGQPEPRAAEDEGHLPDLRDIKGQETAKRALEIAAAGGHNLLMIGPPGSGKSMLAARLPGILPALSPAEALEVSLIQSISGGLPAGLLSRRRPYRNPHHSASMPALIGGGNKVKPGEVSLAHLGVLFLDELPEFSRAVLDSLRQPLETGEAVVARASAHVTFPARFQLVAAMNPCGRVAMLPYVKASLRSFRKEFQKDKGKSLAAYLRLRRLELGLLQKDAATRLGTCEATFANWEKGTRKPSVRYYPLIIEFLGYEPWPVPQSLGEKLMAQRRRLGLSVKRAARDMSIDEGTWTAWERGKRKPTKPSMRLIRSFIAQPDDGWTSRAAVQLTERP